MSYLEEAMADPLVRALHEAADATTIAEDHDELHAAASVVAFDYGDGRLLRDEYLRRWVVNLQQRHNIVAEL